LLDLVAHVWPKDHTVVDEDVLLLVTSEGHHFGHWTAEFLPRLRAWDRRRKLAISAALPRKHRDLLTCFGVTEGDLIECEMRRRIKFRSVQVVYAGSPSAPSRANTAFLYDAFGPRAQNTPTRRLFLVRDAGTRLPANMGEFDALLRDFNIEKVNPAKLAYAAQKDLLADTSLIVGAYGTELYCMFNMHGGTTVIELGWDAALATVYGPTCAFLGLKHHLVPCKRAESKGKVHHNIDSDIIVDCAKLREYLTLALGPAAV
jgi:capsular polysaccharide biosynthesis protein